MDIKQIQEEQSNIRTRIEQLNQFLVSAEFQEISEKQRARTMGYSRSLNEYYHSLIQLANGFNQ